MPKNFFIISAKEVSIKRKGKVAVISYLDPDREGGINLEIGPEIEKMSDLDIVEAHNNMVRNMEEHRKANPYVAREIPDGKPQIERSKVTRQWTACGNVLRCCIESSFRSANVPVMEVDGRRLSWREFGELVSVYEGWGMRIVFVPDDELQKTPAIALAESEEDMPGHEKLLKMKPETSC